jgi:hypothetical protein
LLAPDSFLMTSESAPHPVDKDQKEKRLRAVIAIIAGTFALSVAAPAADAGPPEYNRGHNDCLAGRHNEAQNSDHYRQGCRAGEDERGTDGGPRHWRSTVGIPNVKGMEPIQAFNAMASRGYRNVGTSVVGGMIVGIYFNPVIGECAQLASANNRVVDARDVGTDPHCR